MNQFITIFTANYPHELAVIRGRLESEGIECFLKDELIAQINPFYSNAVGGVKLQVKESDLELAMEILNEGGYAPEKKGKESQFFTQVDKISSKIPLINQLNYEIRFLVMAGVVITVVVCLIIVLIACCYA